MDKKYITNSVEETQKIAAEFAQKILRRKPGKLAVVLALSGDLGAGKTTFLQGFARGLGIEEIINSPTFVIMKKFKIPLISQKVSMHQNVKLCILQYQHFYHFDCYRLESPKPASAFGRTKSASGEIQSAEGYGAVREILELGFKEIISNPKNIVAIEWPEKITPLLPKSLIEIKFEHLEEDKRAVTIF